MASSDRCALLTASPQVSSEGATQVPALAEAREREGVQDGSQRQPVDHLSTAGDLGHLFPAHPFDPLRLRRVRWLAHVHRVLADKDVEPLVQQAVGGPVSEEGAKCIGPPARFLDRLSQSSLFGALPRVDPSGRYLPAPCVGDEPVAPQEQQAAAGVVDHGPGRLTGYPDDMVLEAPQAGHFYVGQAQPDPFALVNGPFTVHDPSHRLTVLADRLPVSCPRRAAVVFDRGMGTSLVAPGVEGLSRAVSALREWQYDGAPFQLHPGDLGWFWRFGAAATATALRLWSRDGQVVGVGLLDGPGLLRLAVAPDAQQSEELARRLVEDLTRPERGVLVDADAYVEAPVGAMVRHLLLDAGWQTDEPWTPLRRDLSEPVNSPGVRVEVIGPDHAPVRAALQRAAFVGSTFTDEHWRTMAAGLPYADARCLVAYDGHGEAVAAATVWSAGAGKPGLLEPMGVHPEHRGQGYGKAITVAAASTLRELGSSSAVTCTPSSNVGAVATYRSAGFQPLPERHDLRLPKVRGPSPRS